MVYTNGTPTHRKLVCGIAEVEFWILHWERFTRAVSDDPVKKLYLIYIETARRNTDNMITAPFLGGQDSAIFRLHEVIFGLLCINNACEEKRVKNIEMSSKLEKLYESARATNIPANATKIVRIHERLSTPAGWNWE